METGAILLGQSIGIIDRIDGVNEIIERIMKDAENTIRKNTSMLN